MWVGEVDLQSRRILDAGVLEHFIALVPGQCSAQRRREPWRRLCRRFWAARRVANPAAEGGEQETRLAARRDLATASRLASLSLDCPDPSSLADLGSP